MIGAKQVPALHIAVAREPKAGPSGAPRASSARRFGRQACLTRVAGMCVGACRWSGRLVARTRYALQIGGPRPWEGVIGGGAPRRDRAPGHEHGGNDMSHVRRFDHVGITVTDLDAATQFFIALGLEIEGRTFVEGEFIDTVIGIPGSRTEIVMLRPPDNGTGVETLELRPA